MRFEITLSAGINVNVPMQLYTVLGKNRHHYALLNIFRSSNLVKLIFRIRQPRSICGLNSKFHEILTIICEDMKLFARLVTSRRYQY